MSDEVKIGVVGLNLGRWQVETVSALEGARVAAVAENAAQVKVPEKGPMSVAEYAAMIGAVPYDDGADMIEKEDLDAVSLCVSPKYREPLLRAAARRKLPVLMEKPMASCLEQARRFAGIVADAGIMLMMEYPLRFFPAMEKLKALLYDETQVEEFDVPPRQQIMRYNMERFVKCVRERTEPACSAAGGLNAQSVVEGFKRSIATGRPVELHELE